MKENLNLIENVKLIKIIKSCEFFFLEELIDMKSPVSEYYFKMNDLSLNLKLKLKWALYGYFFLKSISNEIFLSEPDYATNTLFLDSINPNFTYPKNEHVIYIDSVDVTEIETFTREMSVEYTKVIYDENSAIHLKIKLNITDYVILQNTAYPCLGFYE